MTTKQLHPHLAISREEWRGHHLQRIILLTTQHLVVTTYCVDYQEQLELCSDVLETSSTVALVWYNKLHQTPSSV